MNLRKKLDGITKLDYNYFSIRGPYLKIGTPQLVLKRMSNRYALLLHIWNFVLITIRANILMFRNYIFLEIFRTKLKVVLYEMYQTGCYVLHRFTRNIYLLATREIPSNFCVCQPICFIQNSCLEYKHYILCLSCKVNIQKRSRKRRRESGLFPEIPGECFYTMTDIFVDNS